MNDLHWFWQTIIIFYFGRFILRLGGRKSISQMTITQVVVMVGIGSLLIQPITDKGLVITLTTALIIVGLMIVTEYLEMKFDLLETLSTGKAKIVIEDGKPHVKNLKKLRMSIDRLETRLRQSGISSIDDVKYATIEVSSQIGYELKEEKQPMTKEDFQLLMNELSEVKKSLGLDKVKPIEPDRNASIFKEIITKKHEGNKNEL